MYLEVTGPKNKDYDSDNELKCKAGGMEFAITERFPYYIASQMGHTDGIYSSTYSVPITVQMDRYANSRVPSLGLMRVAGIKLATLPIQNIAIREQGSYFVLVRYLRNPKSHTVVIEDYVFMSGNGWLSLTDFMLDAQAVANAFQSPTKQVRLRGQGIGRQADYLHCHRLEGKKDFYGNEEFKFQLEVNSSELSQGPQLLG
jgi:hypothetical protein